MGRNRVLDKHHIEEHHHLYIPPDTIKLVKSRRVEWTGREKK
jgi:hypothetical protein